MASTVSSIHASLTAVLEPMLVINSLLLLQVFNL